MRKTAKQRIKQLIELRKEKKLKKSLTTFLMKKAAQKSLEKFVGKTYSNAIVKIIAQGVAQTKATEKKIKDQKSSAKAQAVNILSETIKIVCATFTGNALIGKVVIDQVETMLFGKPIAQMINEKLGFSKAEKKELNENIVNCKAKTIALAVTMAQAKNFLERHAKYIPNEALNAGEQIKKKLSTAILGVQFTMKLIEKTLGKTTMGKKIAKSPKFQTFKNAINKIIKQAKKYLQKLSACLKRIKHFKKKPDIKFSSKSNSSQSTRLFKRAKKIITAIKRKSPKPEPE